MSSLVKSRPDVELLLPREIIPGQEVSAVLVLRCRKDVSVDAIRVLFTGTEVWGEVQKRFLSLVADLGGQDLPQGETRLPFRVAIPLGNPPTYAGKAASVRYEASVHVDIPWWPDRRAQFTIFVGPAPQANPPDEAQRYSTRPSGPAGKEPHAELSLTSQWARPGDIISGAFALSNTAYNNYGAAILRLASTESSHFGFRQSMAGRNFVSRIEDTSQGEATMIPFRMSLPKTTTPGIDKGRAGNEVGLFSVKWEFILEVEVRRGRNILIPIPFAILPTDPTAQARPYQAPPVVGSNRTGELWESVGRAHGFEMKGDELRKALGESSVVVRREHQGAEGVFLLASFDYPSLDLGLEVERAGTLRRVMGGGVSFDHPAFDTDYFVRARDAAQARASLEDVFCAKDSSLTTRSARLQSMDDDTCVMTLADNGHSEEMLGAMLVDAGKALGALDDLAEKVTPPTGLADTLKEWEFLRGRLGAAFSAGSLRVNGDQGSVNVGVATLFDKSGRPDATQVRVVPASPLDVAPFEFTADSAEDLLVTTFKGEIAQRLSAALSGAAHFRMDAEELVLEFDAPLGRSPKANKGLLGDVQKLDAAAAALRVGHLVRVVGLLGGESGPYR